MIQFATYRDRFQRHRSRTVFEIDNGFGAVQKFESRDFLFLTADLILGSERVLPGRSDQIEETLRTTTEAYPGLSATVRRPAS